MKSALARMSGARKPPMPLDGASSFRRGHSFSLGVGRGDRETMMRQFGMSGTINSIVSLMAQSAATPTWRVYKKQPVDGRRRYTTADQRVDQRVEMVSHPAIDLLNNPNDMNSGFEFREATWQHLELTGETFWILNMDRGFPTAMWYVRPDRMEPVHAPDGMLLGWMYTGPSGEQVPFKADEVILEKYPDPLDPFRGAGPVASILPNIQQQRYATEYQRNVFLNGADPGGVITVPHALTDREYDELIERWRESHRGVARAGHVGVLEDGMNYAPTGRANKDMDYVELRLTNRDEMREAWRVHKAMLGTSDDVNRANAQTAEEVFIAWSILPRLNRRRDTLNSKLLPLFGSTGTGVEFDYDDPSPVNAENAAAEMVAKAQAFAQLVQAGVDPHDALETVGLPDMDMAADAVPGQLPASPVALPGDRASISIRASSDSAAKVYKQVSRDYPPQAISWMHHASWMGPVSAPLDHIDWTPYDMHGISPQKVAKFVRMIQDGKKLKPVILVKTPSGDKLTLIDGHHRYLAAAQLMQPVRAYVGTVDEDHGPWDLMHEYQYDKQDTGRGALNDATLSKAQVHYRDATSQDRRCGACEMFRSPDGCTLVKGVIRSDAVCDLYAPDAAGDMAAVLRRVMTDGYVPVQTAGRH